MTPKIVRVVLGLDPSTQAMWVLGSSQVEPEDDGMRTKRPGRTAGMARLAAATAALWLIATGSGAEEVGSFTNDWTGNEIVVEALADPKVQGVTCHLTHFERGLIDRVWKGNWFEDPSNASIACRQTGPIVIGAIERDDEGEEVFNERKSFVFKNLAVRRIYDEANQTLVYVVYSRDVVEGSAKMNVSTVALHGADVIWAED